jgi:hypothetical protein
MMSPLTKAGQALEIEVSEKGKQVLPTKMPQLTIDWRSFARWNSGWSTTRRHMIFMAIGLVPITTIVGLAAAIAQ